MPILIRPTFLGKEALFKSKIIKTLNFQSLKYCKWMHIHDTCVWALSLAVKDTVCPVLPRGDLYTYVWSAAFLDAEGL